MKLNEKIQLCRRRGGLSQEELAERVGVSRQAVSKWECGDAVPEPAKLLLLSRTFGVTADWLLDDALGEERQTSEPTVQAPPRRTWLDELPGAIGRFVRRWGWLAGIYLLVIGLLFCGLGGIGRLLFGGMSAAVESVTSELDPFGGLGFSEEIIILDENGNVVDDLPDEVIGQIAGSIGENNSPFPEMPDLGAPMRGISSVAMIVPNAILVLGIFMVIGGGALALILFRMRQGRRGD